MQSAALRYLRSRRAPVLLSLALLVGMFVWYGLRRASEGSSHLDSSHLGPLQPAGIAVDSQGDVYVALERADRVVKISPSRRITVIAGTGDVGYSGDGGPADRAALASPADVAVDSEGDLFIADTGNQRIRRVDAQTHVISTVAGNGTMGGRPGLIATSTGLYLPISVAVDENDDLYIGGTNSDPIRRVDAITGMATRVIGSGVPGNSVASVPATGPFWVTMAGPDMLVFSDPSRESVFVANLPQDTVERVAGSAVCGFGGDGSPAAGALLCFPEGLAVSRDRKLYVADAGNNRIRRIDLDTDIITSVAGNGEAGYSGDGGPAVDASLKGPMGVAVDQADNLYISDTGNDCIRRVSARTGRMTTWIDARLLSRAAYDHSFRKRIF